MKPKKTSKKVLQPEENMFAPNSRFRQQLISEWERNLQKQEKKSQFWLFS